MKYYCICPQRSSWFFEVYTNKKTTIRRINKLKKIFPNNNWEYESGGGIAKTKSMILFEVSTYHYKPELNKECSVAEITERLLNYSIRS